MMSTRAYEDVINIGKSPITQYALQDIINEVLEYGRNIAKKEGYHQSFVVTSGGDKGHLSFITFPDAHQIVSAAEVQLSRCPREGIEGRVNEGQTVVSLSRYGACLPSSQRRTSLVTGMDGPLIEGVGDCIPPWPGSLWQIGRTGSCRGVLSLARSQRQGH